MTYPECIYRYAMRRDLHQLEVRKYVQKWPESEYESDRAVYCYEPKDGNKRHVMISNITEGEIVGNGPKHMWLSKRDDNYARKVFCKHFEDSHDQLLSRLHNVNECIAAAMCGKIISEEEE